MAGSVTKTQAEILWNTYNEDGNNELTVEEVTKALKKEFEDQDDFDVKAKFIYFGQDDVKTITKDEFMKGMMRTDQSIKLKQMFKAMDADESGSLCKAELDAGLEKHGVDKDTRECIIDELEYDDDGKYNIEEFIDVFVFSERFAKTFC